MANGLRNSTAKVIWITGLSGSGKTTLAKLLKNMLSERCENVVHLDGDDLREVLSLQGCCYDKDSRKKLAFVYARFCKLLASQGLTVICSTIALFHDIHAWNRLNLPGYCEIFMNPSMVELLRRDSRGIYQNMTNEHSKNVAGFDFEVEYPLAPDVEIVSDANTDPAESARTVMRILYRD